MRIIREDDGQALRLDGQPHTEAEKRRTDGNTSRGWEIQRRRTWTRRAAESDWPLPGRPPRMCAAARCDVPAECRCGARNQPAGRGSRRPATYSGRSHLAPPRHLSLSISHL